MSAAPLNPAQCEFDVAILGGGLAGLSLAARLATPQFAHLRVLVTERRTEYVRDRTWSYWAASPHPFQAAVAHRWAGWAVAAPGGSVVRAAPPLQYETIPADRFYSNALATVRAAGHIDLRLGTTADATEMPGSVLVRLQGTTVQAAVAFDTRPTPSLGGHGLTQVFLGQEVETEHPVFDPSVATLMDFRGAQAGAAHFTYILPTAPHRAMVEDTWFAPPGFTPPDHRGAIKSYLAGLGAGQYQVNFEETGALPMDPVFQPRAATRLLPLGSAGGATRPSTGYAFTAIQAQCEAIVATLAAGRLPAPARPRPALTRFMDRVMLDLLERQPALAPRLFTALFAGCPPRRLVRFLTDQARPADFVAVAAAIPFWPTMGAAARLARRKVEWRQPAVAG